MSIKNSDYLVRHLTLRQLQLFEIVTRLGSFTRAAEHLHLSQPTISMQIKKMSDSLGLVLLEQVGKKIHPTSAGKTVYRTASDILEHLSMLEDSVSELKGTIKGELGIAVVTTAKYFMPHLLGAFLEKHPEVTPQLTVTNRAKVLKKLQNNEDDLVIMGQAPKGLDVEAFPFLDNELVVVSHPNHPLAKKDAISLREISQTRFLSRERGSGMRLAVEKLFKKSDLKIEPYMELGSSEAIKQGVIAGLGISVLSRNNLKLELLNRYMVVLNVEAFPLKRKWYAVHLKGKQLSLVAKTFLSYMIENAEVVCYPNIDSKQK